MKRILRILIVITLLFSLSACSSQKNNISIIMSDSGKVANSDKVYIENVAQNSIDKISRYFGFKPTQNISICIQDEFSYTDETGVFLKKVLVQNRKAPITHEITHYLMNTTPSVNSGNAFFDEGIACMMEGLYGPKNTFLYFDSKKSEFKFGNVNQEIGKIKNLIKFESLINNNDIFEAIPTSPTKEERINRSNAYVEAGSFFLFVNDKYGKAKVKEFYYSQSILDFKNIFGKSLNDLESEWVSYLKNHHL